MEQITYVQVSDSMPDSASKQKGGVLSFLKYSVRDIQSINDINKLLGLSENDCDCFDQLGVDAYTNIKLYGGAPRVEDIQQIDAVIGPIRDSPDPLAKINSFGFPKPPDDNRLTPGQPCVLDNIAEVLKNECCFWSAYDNTCYIAAIMNMFALCFCDNSFGYPKNPDDGLYDARRIRSSSGIQGTELESIEVGWNAVKNILLDTIKDKNIVIFEPKDLSPFAQEFQRITGGAGDFIPPPNSTLTPGQALPISCIKYFIKSRFVGFCVHCHDNHYVAVAVLDGYYVLEVNTSGLEVASEGAVCFEGQVRHPSGICYWPGIDAYIAHCNSAHGKSFIDFVAIFLGKNQNYAKTCLFDPYRLANMSYTSCRNSNEFNKYITRWFAYFILVCDDYIKAVGFENLDAFNNDTSIANKKYFQTAVDEKGQRKTKYIQILEHETYGAVRFLYDHGMAPMAIYASGWDHDDDRTLNTLKGMKKAYDKITPTLTKLNNDSRILNVLNFWFIKLSQALTIITSTDEIDINSNSYKYLKVLFPYLLDVANAIAPNKEINPISLTALQEAVQPGPIAAGTKRPLPLDQRISLSKDAVAEVYQNIENSITLLINAIQAFDLNPNPNTKQAMIGPAKAYISAIDTFNELLEFIDYDLHVFLSSSSQGYQLNIKAITTDLLEGIDGFVYIKNLAEGLISNIERDQRLISKVALFNGLNSQLPRLQGFQINMVGPAPPAGFPVGILNILAGIAIDPQKVFNFLSKSNKEKVTDIGGKDIINLNILEEVRKTTSEIYTIDAANVNRITVRPPDQQALSEDLDGLKQAIKDYGSLSEANIKTFIFQLYTIYLFLDMPQQKQLYDAWKQGQEQRLNEEVARFQNNEKWRRFGNWVLNLIPKVNVAFKPGTAPTAIDYTQFDPIAKVKGAVSGIKSLADSFSGAIERLDSNQLLNNNNRGNLLSMSKYLDEAVKVLGTKPKNPIVQVSPESEFVRTIKSLILKDLQSGDQWSCLNLVRFFNPKVMIEKLPDNYIKQEFTNFVEDTLRYFCTNRYPLDLPPDEQYLYNLIIKDLYDIYKDDANKNFFGKNHEMLFVP